MKSKGYYIPVLGYHEIGPDEWYYNTTEQFEEHMKYLHDNGYSPIDLQTYHGFWSGQIPQEELPEKPIFIVFDDGRSGVYDHAFPILKKYNFSFVIYVIGEVVGNRDFVTWGQIREMVNSGLCDLGNHTHDLHYFDLEGADGSTWGAAAIRIWRDNGIYAFDTSIKGTRLESGSNALSRFWGMPIAGTAKNYETGALYPIKTYLGFQAYKTYTADRIIIKCPTHIPAETFYDVKVKVTLGEKNGPTGIINPTVVNAAWEPKHEPVDLVNKDLGETWVNGRFDVIYFDQPYTFQIGKWYNIYLETLNMDKEQKEMRIYCDPSLDQSIENCATNSQSTDYNTINGWAIHHARPMIILSDGTGAAESVQEYEARVNMDIDHIKRVLEERAGNCITEHRVPVQQTVNGQSTAIPLYGASYCQTNPETKEGIEGSFEKLECNLKVSFGESFTATKLIYSPETPYGREYVALVDFFIGDWNNGSPENFQLVRKMYFPVYGWRDTPGGLVEVKFDEGITFNVVASHEYCIKIVTRNYDKFVHEETGERLPIEGTFRIQGTYNKSGKVTAFWNSRTGDGEPGTDNITRVCVQPHIWLYYETSTYPIGRYEPPVWSIAFPFGAYTPELNTLQYNKGMELQFTIYQGVLDTRENHNEAAVEDLKQIPRVMMFNDNLTISFKDQIELNTLEMFIPKQNTKKVDIYAYVINREWGCHSLRENWRQIDVGIFDAYNFDTSLNISGSANPDWTWFKSKGKKVYAMFGNFGTKGFDPDISTAVFNDPVKSINAIENIIINEGWDGIAIDFEEVRPEDRAKATLWFKALSNRFRTPERYHPIFVAAPYPFATTPSWAEWFDYVEVAKVSDKISPMTYLDHGSWTLPGPVSDMKLFKQRYAELIKIGVPPYKITGGLGVFGCVWTPEEKAEKNLLEIHMRMNLKRLPELDSEADEWHCWMDGGGEAWFQGPNTFQNRMDWLYDSDIRSIAIWKLDDDDFSFWSAGFGAHQYKFNNPVHYNFGS
ncbi:polysaccharide deacetylase family protein [Cytobacillus oceanisediminis]|uniref:polysaccharide deacetylase family protein n=1 Tax=Cytobacillus oceanisediminis TaxID=665099 RepID=UPI002040F36C|nr:polysaccharide deacetylase family protein [Cytobacillus oceanisediminis]